MTIVWFVVGCFAGGVVVWMIANSRAHGRRAVVEIQLAERDRELERLRAVVASQEQTLKLKEQEIVAERAAHTAVREDVARLNAQILAEQRSTEEKIKALVDMETSLKTSFQALAGRLWMQTAGGWWRWRRVSWISSRWNRPKNWRRRSRRSRCC